MITASFRKLAEEMADKIYNSQEIAEGEVDDNHSDNRKYLRGLFDNAGSFENSANREIKKLLPRGGDKQGGNPFLKLAQHSYKFAINTRTHLFKLSSPAYQQVAFLGFQKELEKLGDAITRMKGAVGTMKTNVARLPAPTPLAEPNALLGSMQKRAAFPIPTPGIPGKTLGRATSGNALQRVQIKNQTAMRQPTKAWDASRMAGEMGING